jgi:ribosomal-protein-alanine N-acetyltransferase
MMKTTRLTLMPLGKHDFKTFQKINTDAYVRKYLWDDEVISAEVLQQIMNDVESHFKNDGWGLWKIVTHESETIIGYAGLWRFFDEHQPQLLYVLLPDFTGKGYATEVANEIISYAFDELNFSQLIATMDKANVSSVKVCERLGFEFIEERDVEGKPILFYKIERQN